MELNVPAVLPEWFHNRRDYKGNPFTDVQPRIGPTRTVISWVQQGSITPYQLVIFVSVSRISEGSQLFPPSPREILSAVFAYILQKECPCLVSLWLLLSFKLQCRVFMAGIFGDMRSHWVVSHSQLK